MALNTYVYQIQAFLFTASTLLLAGSLISLFMKHRLISDGFILSVAGNDEGSNEKAESFREKRKSRRVPSNTVLEVMSPTGEFIPDSAQTHDLSSTGACFDSPFIIGKGKQIKVRLHTSHQGQMQISAHIVWLKPKNNRMMYGIEFDDVHPTHA